MSFLRLGGQQTCVLLVEYLFQILARKPDIVIENVIFLTVPLSKIDST
jgi:hypothetical protein